MAKSSVYLLPIFQEKFNYFLLHFCPFLVKKGAWSREKGAKSKSNQAYVGATIPGVQDLQRVWSHYLLALSFSVTKVVFLKFSWLFEVWLLFQLPHLITWQKYLQFPMQNLILHPLISILTQYDKHERSNTIVFFWLHRDFWPIY